MGMMTKFPLVAKSNLFQFTILETWDSYTLIIAGSLQVQRGRDIERGELGRWKFKIQTESRKSEL